ncbi:NAD(P)/FAD-dependent oxidoreductase [Microbacterium barkeri]|uniref:FAD-dependent oxidoreductase n=1 Tax=Microbacterium barkeri TaxID=33917 RepID=UPI0024AF861B|nr:NAD(P)/FAD-dependent oxidoreductase [Microbacterium barkeri]MDI6942750.1 NAD(P)/FAD-dependent oxidoreductase [Microbacterium barkeri]
MLIPTALDAQLAAQRHDRLRVLVIGAGVAGITAAQLLRRQGLHPVLVDHLPTMDHPGYMLALMPTVDGAFADLGVQEACRAAGTPLARYRFRSHRGRPLRTDPLGELLRVYGDYNGIARGALLDVLTSHGCPVTWGTTIDRVDADGHARFVDREGSPQASAPFDLVIGADGIRSRMRAVLGAAEPDVVTTGWSGWVAWADDLGEHDLGEEVWGDGFFLGVYPVKDRLGVFLGGPDEELLDGPAAFAERVRQKTSGLGTRLEAALIAVVEAPDPHLWRLDDARARRWVLSRGVLLGDAAAGFLPTAGMGAGMAIESAWMLARMLAHAERDTLTAVLHAWERIERPRVEAAQGTSRALARLMFRRGADVAWLRESLMRVLSVRAALRPILRLLAERPDPDAVARDVTSPARRTSP